MPQLIDRPIQIEAVGNKPKIIREFFGRVASQDEGISIAHMQSPQGWEEPGQRPTFREYTVVLKGTLEVEFEGGKTCVSSGQAIVAEPGEWVRYRTPEAGGAEYIAVCLPAFSPESVHRDEV